VEEDLTRNDMMTFPQTPVNAFGDHAALLNLFSIMKMLQKGFFLALFVFFAFLVGALAQSSTSFTSPSPITRTNDPQYAISLEGTFNNPSFLDHTPIRLGSSGRLTVELELYPRSFEGCIWSYGSPTTESYISLQITQNGKLRLRNGAWNFSEHELITNTTVINELNKWYTISVTLVNTRTNSSSSTYATAQIYVNGALVHSGRVRPLIDAVRKGFIGSCQYTSRWDRTFQEPLTLNAVVDNYRIWGVARTAQQIQEYHDLVSRQVLITDTTGLFFHAFFVEGFGLTASVLQGPLLDSYFVLSLQYVSSFVCLFHCINFGLNTLSLLLLLLSS
jgi:hypothetical protein